MNPFTLRSLAAAALCAVVGLGLSSCSSPIENRIASNPQLYGKLNSNDKVLVNEGRIREGMTKEAVFLSWGRPDQVAAGKQKGVTAEKWTYIGSQPIYNDTIGFGGPRWGGRYGYGYGYGYGGMWDPYWGGYGPSVTYVPYKEASVTFRSNRVAEYLKGPQ